MRKRSGQVHSRESSATLQLTVSLLYLLKWIAFSAESVYTIIKSRDVLLHLSNESCDGSDRTVK